MADSTVVLHLSLDREEIEFTESASLDIPKGAQLSSGVMLLQGEHVLHSCSPVHYLWNFKMNRTCFFGFQGAEALHPLPQVSVITTSRLGC